VLNGPFGLDIDLELAHIKATQADAKLFAQKLAKRAAQPEKRIMGPNKPIALDDQIDLIASQRPLHYLRAMAFGSALLQYPVSFCKEV